MQHSKSAIWRAVNSEHGDRLVEIAREHMRLVKEFPDRPAPAIAAAGVDPIEDIRQIIYAKIDQLRTERDAIIQKYKVE